MATLRVDLRAGAVSVPLDEPKSVPNTNQRAPVCASSKYAHKAFTNCICRGVLQRTRVSSGLPTKITSACAREVATFSRLRLYRNSSPRGASSALDEVIE